MQQAERLPPLELPRTVGAFQEGSGPACGQEKRAGTDTYSGGRGDAPGTVRRGSQLEHVTENMSEPEVVNDRNVGHSHLLLTASISRNNSGNVHKHLNKSAISYISVYSICGIY